MKLGHVHTLQIADETFVAADPAAVGRAVADRAAWRRWFPDLLLEVEPQTFHFTAHYKDYPCVLARMETLHPGSFRNFLERRFRKVAKKTAVKAWEAAKAS